MQEESFMLRTRWHYWTCSKFADWIRGEKKPYALEWGGWEVWEQEQKAKRPIRFWLSDTGLKWLQNIVYFPSDIYHTIDCYVSNRWISKTHYLKTGFKPGGYYEFDEKIIHALFNELVDFVEKDLAHMGNFNSKEKYTFKNGRCVEAAYNYFKWAKNLKDTLPNGKRVLSQQAKGSRKIKQLYEWWTKKRPNRPDPYEASGWSKVCELSSLSDFSAKQQSKQNQAMKKLIQIEDKYDNEDTAMLIELIKIRHHLWS
jgi:hypothetical protein